MEIKIGPVHVDVHQYSDSPLLARMADQLGVLIEQGKAIMSGLDRIDTAEKAEAATIAKLVDFITNTVPAQTKAAVDAALAGQEQQANDIADKMTQDGAALAALVPTPVDPGTAAAG